MHIGNLRFSAFLSGIIQDPCLDLDPDKIHLRVQHGHLGNEIPLSRTQLNPERRIGAGKHRPPAALIFLRSGQMDKRIILADGIVNPGFSS